jgi:hypothetical protein
MGTTYEIPFYVIFLVLLLVHLFLFFHALPLLPVLIQNEFRNYESLGIWLKDANIHSCLELYSISS